MKKALAFGISFWLLLVTVSIYWNYSSMLSKQQELLLQAARSYFAQIVLSRAWVAFHGGVYVPVTMETRPNEYLETPMREIVVNENLTLTKINPAFMTRQISEMAQKRNGVQFHITSLKPTRPGNIPDMMEKLALQGFEKGETETAFLFNESGKRYFFFMAPLVTEKTCLQCHAKQNYKVGDIRGGISVILPYSLNMPIVSLVTGHIIIALVGVAGMIIGGRKLSGAYARLRHQSITDTLTEIPNRRNFSETLLKEFNRCKRTQNPLSVIMCDIDYFKSFNDTFGHDKGDECLKSVAKAVDSALKRPGDFCARYGGEEFVVILPETSAEGAYHVAENIRMAVEDLRIPSKANSFLPYVTISLGVTTSDLESPIDPELLTKYADEALYAAKANGRNRVEVH